MRPQRFEQRDAGGDDRRGVVRRLAQHLRPADRELVVRRVDDRGLRTGRPDVDHAVATRRRLDQTRGADGVARVEDGAAGHRAHHRQVLERHLGRAVLADRHAGVRSGELDVQRPDAGHPHEVGGPGQKRGERRRERDGAAAGQPHRRADHRLLGDVGLDEPAGMRVLERLAERGVADVRVERHDPRVRGAERGQRIAVRGPRRHPAPRLVGRRRREPRRAGGSRRRRRAGRRGGNGRRRGGRHEPAVQFVERAVEVGTRRDRLAVPAVLPLDERHPLALHRAGENHRRPSGGPRGFLQRREDRADVVAVDDDRMPAEGAPPLPVAVQVVAPLRRPALAEPVDVRDGAQVVEPVAVRDLGRLPHRALRRLPVADQHVGPMRRADAPGVERDADRGADALPERSGRHVDERKARRRVPFQIAVDPAEPEQIVRRHETRLGPGGVEQRRGMPLREDEAVVVVVPRVPRVEPHVPEEQRRDEVGGRAAARRMPAARRARGAHRGDPQSGRDLLQRGNDGGGIGRHGFSGAGSLARRPPVSGRRRDGRGRRPAAPSKHPDTRSGPGRRDGRGRRPAALCGNR